MKSLYFDAWGRRRALRPRHAPCYTYTTVNSQTDRGFTGHEMLDAVGLIHMNGRIYDPTIGRFLSVDPLVQEPQNLQNYNRYSYVQNNPLSLTDPSGFSFLGGIGKWLGKNWKQVTAVAVGVVLGAICAPLGSLAFAAISGFGSAFTGTLLAGGSVGDAFRAGLTGAAISLGTAYAFGQVSNAAGFHAEDFAGYAKEGTLKYGEKLAEMTIAHGLIGGAASVAGGGKFVHGFEAGAASAAGSPLIDVASDENAALGATASAIVGGTASAIGGGKFANGAVTGAMGYLFNWFGASRNLHGADASTLYYGELSKDQINAACQGWDACYPTEPYRLSTPDGLLVTAIFFYGPRSEEAWQQTVLDRLDRLPNAPTLSPEARAATIDFGKQLAEGYVESIPVVGKYLGPFLGPLNFVNGLYGEHGTYRPVFERDLRGLKQINGE